MPGTGDQLRAHRLRTLNWVVDDQHYQNAAHELRYRLLKPLIDETYDPTDGDYPATVPDAIVSASASRTT